MKEKFSLEDWFPLIRLFLFVSFFVSLFAVGLFILNPAKQHDTENNAKRQADVMLIANAIAQYISNTQGNSPAHLSTRDQEIAASGVDLCKVLIPDYLISLPADPALDSPDVTQPCPPDYKTQYHILIDTKNTITVSAPDTAMPPAERIISVTRNTYEK